MNFKAELLFAYTYVHICMFQSVWVAVWVYAHYGELLLRLSVCVCVFASEPYSMQNINKIVQ